MYIARQSHRSTASHEANGLPFQALTLHLDRIDEVLSILVRKDDVAQEQVYLSGVPIFDLQEIAGKAAAIGVHPEQGTTLREMVIENLLLERRKVEAYTALIREIGEKDLITREILLDILGETETHASELSDF